MQKQIWKLLISYVKVYIHMIRFPPKWYHKHKLLLEQLKNNLTIYSRKSHPDDNTKQRHEGLGDDKFSLMSVLRHLVCQNLWSSRLGRRLHCAPMPRGDYKYLRLWSSSSKFWKFWNIFFYFPGANVSLGAHVFEKLRKAVNMLFAQRTSSPSRSKFARCLLMTATFCVVWALSVHFMCVCYGTKRTCTSISQWSLEIFLAHAHQLQNTPNATHYRRPFASLFYILPPSQHVQAY